MKQFDHVTLSSVKICFLIQRLKIYQLIITVWKMNNEKLIAIVVISCCLLSLFFVSSHTAVLKNTVSFMTINELKRAETSLLIQSQTVLIINTLTAPTGQEKKNH